MTTVKRGCGDSRTEGDMYIVEEMSSHGTPLKYFLIDPPITPRNSDGSIFRPGAQGMMLIPGEGDTYNLLDWIGEGFYHTIPDFYMEGAAFGFSRKIQRNFDFSKLTVNSTHMFMHPRAIPVLVDNDLDYLFEEEKKMLDMSMPIPFKCPRPEDQHVDSEQYCIRLNWQLIDKYKVGRYEKQILPKNLKKGGEPSMVYNGWTPPVDFDPIWIPGVFMQLPIHAIEVIADPHDHRDLEAIEILQDSHVQIPWRVVNE